MLGVLHYCQILPTTGVVRSTVHHTHSTSPSATAAQAATLRRIIIVCVPFGLFNYFPHEICFTLSMPLRVRKIVIFEKFLE